MTPSSIITLTTDFGLQDHYVGAMKGAILSRHPQAQIVDISHEIPAFSLLSGAYAIAQAAPYFPPGTVHVVVVDPGVGTNRRAIVVSTDEQTFVAPDNGVLTLALKRAPGYIVRLIENADLFRHPVSSTFHGRDIFGPVAASIASGVDPASVGPEIADLILLGGTEPEQTAPGRWRGLVLSSDHFGNLITNFPSLEFGRSGVAILVAGQDVRDFQATFGSVPEGALFLYNGSSGFVEIAANQSNAAQALGAKAGDPVELILGQ
jgi:S-adenosyl-L-methionine hydrolase (adenosine-forming)